VKARNSARKGVAEVRDVVQSVSSDLAPSDFEFWGRIAYFAYGLWGHEPLPDGVRLCSQDFDPMSPPG